MRHFRSQSGKRWFRPETFRALLHLRGIECGVEMAEAFYFRKQLLLEGVVRSEDIGRSLSEDIGYT